MSRRPRLTAAEWAAMRDSLWLRSGGRCEFCRGSFDGSMVLHHRQAKSAGGKDEEANLVAIHDECHRWAHDHPVKARVLGWVVPSWDDPAVVPVQVARIH